MSNSAIVEQDHQLMIIDKLKEIVSRVTDICIDDEKENLLRNRYGISPEDLVYFLIIASKEMNFIINDDFVEAIEDFSLSTIAKKISALILIRQ